MDAFVHERSRDSAAITTHPDDPDPALAIRHRNQAIRLSLQGHFAESESFSREALRLRPDDVDILNELGVALWRQGRSAEAEAIYRRACEIEPNDFRILTNLGLALHSHGKVEEAGDSFRKAIEIRPDTFEAVMNLGIVLSDQGKFDEAPARLELARSSCGPTSADALQNIGMNLGRQGAGTKRSPIMTPPCGRSPSFPKCIEISPTRCSAAAITSAAGPSTNGG